MKTEILKINSRFPDESFNWKASKEYVSFDSEGIRSKLTETEKPCFIIQNGKRVGISNTSNNDPESSLSPVLSIPPCGIRQFGDPEFKRFHGTEYNLYAGAMAKGISSEEMVIKLAKNGFMGSFGAGGLTQSQVESAIIKIKSALSSGEPFIFNLLHNPYEPKVERDIVNLYLKHGISCVEAAAFISISKNLVLYRASGLTRDEAGNIKIGNRVIAKISRGEVAQRFMRPAPMEKIQELLESKLITEEQAELSQLVPMADDITVEADSGGHTDNRALIALLPTIIELRNEVMAEHDYENPVRVGAAGGIGTPQAALAAFTMGAAYVVTGSVNQSCIESGSSGKTRKLLSEADMADVTMAPAADMFEMGVKVQVLKRGTLFPMKARKLYSIYKEYDSIDDIPGELREKLEKQIFRRKIEDIWKDTIEFFYKVDISQIEQAEKDPKKKMALIFRWYLGLASHWANTGERGRDADYQIWCGPSMGAFNMWVKGSFLESPENRKVAVVAKNILLGASYLKRLQDLKFKGVEIKEDLSSYKPMEL